MRNAVMALSLSACLAGCAGAGAVDTAGLTVTGDQVGGKIPNGMTNIPAAMRAATAHCAQYSKKAMLTQMQTQKEGGLVAFECH